MDNAQLINQDSGNTEYYTPTEIVDAARYVMGGIDLDPFSSNEANERVKADSFYHSNGLDSNWFGRVWMNHPFSRDMNGPCIKKLVLCFEDKQIEQGCCITFAATSEKWFRPLHKYPQCYLVPRTNYYLPDGAVKKGVTKGSVVTYLGNNNMRFLKVFSEFGEVKFPFIGSKGD